MNQRWALTQEALALQITALDDDTAAIAGKLARDIAGDPDDQDDDEDDDEDNNDDEDDS